MPVKKFIFLPSFTSLLSHGFRENVAKSIRDAAIQRVRVDTGQLKISIKEERTGMHTNTVSAEAPHALVQEYGHPTSKAYGFTPYMRPAVREVMTGSKLRSLFNSAYREARSQSKV